ncbi:flagellar protein FlaI [Methanocalculus sp. AMF5]|nr:flagellar protein FlaI [Methanocalculus sp. AMF5]
MDEEEKKDERRDLFAPDSDHFGSEKKPARKKGFFSRFLSKNDYNNSRPVTNPWDDAPSQDTVTESEEGVSAADQESSDTLEDESDSRGARDIDPPGMREEAETPRDPLSETRDADHAILDDAEPDEAEPDEAEPEPPASPHPYPGSEPGDVHVEEDESRVDVHAYPAAPVASGETRATESEQPLAESTPPESLLPFSREDPVPAAAEEESVPERRYLLRAFRKKETMLQVPEYDYETTGPLVRAELTEDEEEVDGYWVEKGLSLVSITYNRITRLNEYRLFEPVLLPFEYELLERLYEDLRDILILTDEEIREQPRTLLFRKIEALLSQYGLNLPTETVYKLRYYLKRNFLGWSRIDPLMKDLDIEDISCDGHDIPLFLYHRRHRNIRTNIRFPEQQLNSLAISLAQRSGKHISIGNPILDSTLPDGSRLQLTLGTEVTSRGSSFTIRKFRPEPFTPIELMEKGTFTVDQLVYFWLAIENNKSLLYIGGTASGKTSSLNAMSLFIPPLAKVVSIEDTREIMLYRENWIASVTRESLTAEGSRSINMFDLLKAAMRQRPEFIIVGEVRGPEAQTLFQAMNTGHTTYSTMHAGGVDATIHRLESEPLNVPRNMLQALNIISVQGLIFRGSERVRRCQEIVEITGIEPNSGNILVNNVFEYDPVSDEMRYSGRSHVYSAIAANRGWSREELAREVGKRRQVIQALHEQNIRDFRSVSEIFSIFAITPDVIFDNIDDLSVVLT